ncbi:LmbE family N-acetylglucosaminyl deacetylase [Herbihabitans rhizosphaerae]|uniref:LmbE family N-acetylglucosaminyl deacetylase n=1 Tax=Herbihabitans rhizosphaerae TaxID=1872711 RepID=A0A4Q7KDY7_9PSEU|nr:PIG-L family deacetylase [Herbihabitans rhizosphaerae]RZS32445.1 LmbE family N-acetylglucosaminyl deacetylase [Herbihabitans rhizosphaerae]
MNVLAVGAHPDDLEILAAGSLALYARDGHRVTMCVLTKGDLGSDTHTRAETAAIRRAEAEESAAVIGADFFCLDQPDGFLFDGPDVRTRLVDVMRSAKPDVVITHHPDDYHPDHRAASRIVLNCRQLGLCGLVETANEPTDTIPGVLYMDTLTGIGFQPELWVDITETIDTKRAMLRKHASQNEWLKRLHGTDYVDYVDRQGTLRGLQIETAYAEGFQAAKAYPQPRDPGRLLPPSL